LLHKTKKSNESKVKTRTLFTIINKKKARAQKNTGLVNLAATYADEAFLVSTSDGV
jgi:hypothetical protein